MADQIPRLEDDLELIEVMKKEMKFVEDPALADWHPPGGQSDAVVDQRKFELIKYFERLYCDTDQDTVLYSPEFTVVVRNILWGKRPVKLRYLTDFDGEEK